MVDSFAVVAGLPPHARAERHMTARSGEDLLAAVIDEVISWLDADGEIPSPSWYGRHRMAGSSCSWCFARAAGAEIFGAVPKAASPRGLRCAPNPGGPVVMRGHGRRVATAGWSALDDAERHQHGHLPA
jgi:hypothetical protein